MMKLTFSTALVRVLVDFTEQADAHHEGWGGRGLLLVGDEGVYLMSTGITKSSKPTIIYSRECNPKTMEFDQWWEAKQAAYGGDDGGDLIDLETAKRWVEGADDLLWVEMKADSFAMGSTSRKGVAR